MKAPTTSRIANSGRRHKKKVCDFIYIYPTGFFHDEKAKKEEREGAGPFSLLSPV
jgi:hypothetical protein